MANKRPNPVPQLKSPPTVLADPAGIQQAMNKVGNVMPPKAGNGRFMTLADLHEAFAGTRMHTTSPEASQAIKPEMVKVSGYTTQASHGFPGGEHAHGLGRSSLLASATPSGSAAAIPSLLVKLAAQDNAYPQRSASGEAHGLSVVQGQRLRPGPAGLGRQTRPTAVAMPATRTTAAASRLRHPVRRSRP